MNKKRFILLSIILFVVALIVYTSNIEKGNIDNEIKIGGIFALTGVGADQGEQELNAGLMAVSDINARAGINGRKIKLITGDVSIDKLGMAVSVVKKEIDIEKVVSIVGTTWDEPASVIVPIADKDKIPMIGQNQTRMIKENNSYPYFFSTWYDNEIGIRKMLEYAQKQNWKRIAIIRPAPIGFYEYVAQKVKLLSEEYGVSIVGNENLNNPAATDFRTPLTKIKALNPDAIVVVLGGLTECPFLKQEKELGMNIPVLATESALNSISLNQCSSIMENLYISYPKETKK
jgi:branched-chain amino acid transport system substrate-binding protein